MCHLSIALNLIFQDLDCLSETATITVTDANNCVFTLPITFTNPCVNFTHLGVNYIRGLSYEANVVGGTAPYTYTWIVPNNFEIFRQTNNAVTIHIKDPSLLQGNVTYIIRSIVTDANGCQVEVIYPIVLCIPSLPNKAVALACQSQSSQSIIVYDNNDCEYPIVWDTLSFTGIPRGMTLHNNGDGSVTVTASPSVAPGNYSIHVTVQNSLGIISQTALLHVFVPDCTFEGAISLISRHEAVDCATPTAIYSFSIPGHTSSTHPLDYSTFEFLHLPNQYVSGGVLYSPYFNARLVGTNIIVQFTSLPPISDVLYWKICNTGNVCDQAVITFTSNCNSPAPNAVADTMCAVCGNSTPFFNLTANDTGTFIPSSVTIVMQPQHGTVTLDANGLVSYTADANFSGMDTFSYTISDGNVTSLPAIVTVDVTCAGSPLQNALC